MKFNVEYKMCYTYNLQVTASRRQDVVDEADRLFDRLLKKGYEERYETDAIRYVTKIKKVK